MIDIVTGFITVGWMIFAVWHCIWVAYLLWYEKSKNGAVDLAILTSILLFGWAMGPVIFVANLPWHKKIF